MKGKEKCRALKEIRKAIADSNGIEYAVEECPFQGECKGTCPKCEAELRSLEKELENRQKMGKAIVIAGVSLSAASFMTACTPDILSILPSKAGGGDLDGEALPPDLEGMPTVDESLLNEESYYLGEAFDNYYCTKVFSDSLSADEFDISNYFSTDFLNEASVCDDKIVSMDEEIFDCMTDFYRNSFKSKHSYKDNYKYKEEYLAYSEPIEIFDFYRENEEYNVEKHCCDLLFTDSSKAISVQATIVYYQIISDSNDFTEVNDRLRMTAFAFLNKYMSEDMDFDNENGVSEYKVFVDSFVTYNDDNIISFCNTVESCRCYSLNGWENSQSVDREFVFGVNVDIQNAVLMDNKQIIDFTDDFASDLYQRYQAFTDLYSELNKLSTEQIKEILQSEGLILYFTPYGMEIGFNTHYTFYDDWIYVTYNNYDDYKTDVYDYDSSFGHEFDYDGVFGEGLRCKEFRKN